MGLEANNNEQPNNNPDSHLNVFRFIVGMRFNASTRSAEEMRGIQQHAGFLTSSLDYVGSTDSYHYFEQDLFVLGQSKLTDTKLYRVPKEELAFTDVEEIPYRLPEGKKVEVKISSASPYTLRKCQDKHEKYKEEAKRLKEAQERVFKAILDKANGKTLSEQPPAPNSTSEKEP
jgi:predicted DNA-binding antitoxin AbrB/MazE fold protein